MRVSRRCKRWMVWLATVAAGIDFLAASSEEAHNWSLHVSSAGALATYDAALVLVVTVVVALTRKGRHEGWFHPLSLPFVAIAIMSFGALLWVYVTHEPVGLLFANGYQPVDGSALAVAVSVKAVEALTLVVTGYLIGAGVALAIIRQPGLALIDQERNAFRDRTMRGAGLTLMTTGAVSELMVAYLGRGTAYGVNQFQYGLPSILGPGAATTLLAGLILVTLAACRKTKPKRMRDLLRGREWAALSLYLLAVALTGARGGLINPLVYLAWVYSTQVRVIATRWIVATVLMALIGGAVITNYRAGDGLSLGSPSAEVQKAVDAVSSTAWLTQQTVTAVPSAVGYMHGSTYLAAAEGQLPGPVSRRLGATSRTASTVFRSIIGFYDPNQGFAESYPSEAYLNFGLPGCLIAGLLLGALMGWAWRKARKIVTRPLDLLYPVLLAGLIAGFRSDALAQIKEVLYPMLAVWFLMGLYRLRSPVVGRVAQQIVPLGAGKPLPATQPSAPPAFVTRPR